VAHKLPILFAVDDDPAVIRAVARDLRAGFKEHYRIMSTTSALEALEALAELKRQNETVALFLSDQRMPEMLGVDFLKQAREFYPDAKRVLLTAYSDIEAAIRAINDVQLDYYLTKPWDPPEDKLFPVLNELLFDWQQTYVPVFEGIHILGYQFAPRSHDLKDFLGSNLIPYRWLDVQTAPEAAELMLTHHVKQADLPVVVLTDGTALRNPTVQDVAAAIGLKATATHPLYDVAIIGAGPAGLAAAVYGASEGLRTLLIERKAPGGQAGTSSRIENYLGFPTGLSGAELTRRAVTQATRFGAEFLSPQEVRNIRFQDGYKIVELADGQVVNARALVLASGVDYRTLEGNGLERYTGAGVYYGAATTEAVACQNKEVFIVGGGNSAGQAAMYLSKYARQVNIVIRSEGLQATMSSYLIDQIAGTPNIEVLPYTQIVSADGTEHLECIRLHNSATNTEWEAQPAAVFIFIGARPNTDWLSSEPLRDPRGFLLTGRDAMQHPEFGTVWKMAREPFLLETAQPGVFAAGDVRATAMNRVASAVGEGSMAISFVHKYLAEN
jgi:thioredoxin reductase (NADPH)